MPIRYSRKSTSLAAQTAALSMVAPQVVAHRVLRMALAGASPSARDRQEFHRMGAEKISAFSQSWNAMLLQAFRANQEMAISLVLSFWFPWMRRAPSMRSVSRHWSNATLDILGKGMAPIRRRATANAKRLYRIRPS